MRLAFLALAVLTLAAAARAQSGRDAPMAGPVVVDGDLVRVVLPSPADLPRARGLVRDAERALRAAAAFWDVPPPTVTVVVRGADDLFNAWVDPLGGPVVSLPEARAWPGEPGADAPDPTFFLLLHEMIHAVHFGGRPGSLPVPSGLVGGAAPWPPPMWLLEGVAVWAESHLVPGGAGRVSDPDARSVLRALAASGAWPALDDAALATHAAWPGGRVRYLAGGALVERMIDAAGLPAFRAALRRFETQAPWLGFADAWRAETGLDLGAQWRALRDASLAEARALPDLVGPILVGPDLAPTDVAHGPMESPAVSPDGARLAWRSGHAILVAPFGPGPDARTGASTGGAAGLGPVRRYDLPGPPEDLAWWGPDRLVYARLRSGPDGRIRDLHVLDLGTGAETRRTRGARGRAPAPTGDGCLAFARDDGPGASHLRLWCPGGPPDGRVAWTPPADARIVGLAASPSGRLAVLTDADGVRSARILPAGAAPTAAGTPVPLPARGARDPAWEGEGALWIVARADDARTGAWRLDLVGGTAELRAAPRFGARDVAPGVVAAGRAGGPVLVRTLDPPLGLPVEPGPPQELAAAPRASDSDGVRVDGAGPRSAVAEPDAAATRPPGAPAARTYDPRAELRLLGWLPASADGGLGVRVVAVDPARRYRVAVVAGATASGGSAPGGSAPGGTAPGGTGTGGAGHGGAPVWFGVEARVGDAGLVATPGPAAPATLDVRAGLLPVTPHRVAPLGPRPRLDAALAARLAWEPAVTLRLDGTLQLLDGRPRAGGSVRLAASSGRVDAWGVPTRGWAVAATARVDPLPVGASAGAWVDAAAWRPPWREGAPATRLSARVGARPPAPAPGAPWRDVAASAALGATWDVPVRWRVADGRWALERIRLGPTLRAGVGAGAEGGTATTFGVEGSVTADAVAGYGAPVSAGVRFGVGWGAGRPAEAWLRWALPNGF